MFKVHIVIAITTGIMALSLQASAQETTPLETKKVAKLNQKHKIKHLQFKKTQTSAIKRLQSIQTMWAELEKTTTPAALKVQLNTILFTSMSLDMELKTLQQAYKVERARKGVRAVKRASTKNNALADHLRALKKEKALTIDALKQKEYTERLRTLLGQLQTLPQYTPK